MLCWQPLRLIPAVFVNMSTALRDDLDVALAAIRADPCNFVYAGDSVRADRRAALAAFRSAAQPSRQGNPLCCSLLPVPSCRQTARWCLLRCGAGVMGRQGSGPGDYGWHLHVVNPGGLCEQTVEVSYAARFGLR